MTTRRLFLSSALGFLAAPAIVRASSIMPVKALPRELHFVCETSYQHLPMEMSDDLNNWVPVTPYSGPCRRYVRAILPNGAQLPVIKIT